MTEAAKGYLLDASAILALLHREPGADTVAAILGGSAVSAVNWSEVLQRAGERGIDVAELDDDFTSLGVRIIDFARPEALQTARLWLQGHRALSLADRACLATAAVHGLAVATTDRLWADVEHGIPVTVIR
ncbi:MAG: type II toxin-antitoxin system VapC family toxin [Chloroflexota bacterium]